MEGGTSSRNTKTTKIIGTIEITSTERIATITLGPIKTTTGTPTIIGDANQLK